MKKEVNMRKSYVPYNEHDYHTDMRIPIEERDIDPAGERIITDPFGSWTGVPTDNYFDKPIQDVDDL